MAAAPAEASAPKTSAGLRPSVARAVSFRFALAPEDGDAFAARLEQLSGVAATNTVIDTIILDTPDHAIAGSGLGFGIRRSGDAGGRRGWKKFVTPLSSATPKAARRGLNRSLRRADAISVVARVETRRRLWELRFGECRAELWVDLSTGQMNGKEIAVASAIFASDAPNADFCHFVTAVCDPERLRLCAESDLRRIYRLCEGALPAHVTAFAPELDADMDAAAAFRVIATACFDQFLLNEAAIRATGDREAVHQCRVALRRLSACLRFFKAFVAGADYEALWQEFKELGADLRKARDLDVLIADVLAPALAHDPPSGAKVLMREIEARRDKAHADLAAMLRRPAAAALFLRFAIWLQIGDWTCSADPKSQRRRFMPIVKYARREFAALNRKFALRCLQLPQMEQEERHRTRIRAKNLRYDAEFLKTLARRQTARKRLAAFIDAVKGLQTVLGDWNDVLMARQFLNSLALEDKGKPEGEVQGEAKMPAKPKRPSLAAAAEALRQRIEAIAETEFNERSAKACQALGDAKPFWTKLA